METLAYPKHEDSLVFVADHELRNAVFLRRCIMGEKQALACKQALSILQQELQQPYPVGLYRSRNIPLVACLCDFTRGLQQPLGIKIMGEIKDVRIIWVDPKLTIRTAVHW